MSEPVNADPAELAKFSELAHRWWDPDGEFRPLHQINPLRLDWIDGFCELSGKRVLDVSCGGGILADAIDLKGAEVLGIEQPASFDAVTCMEMLEHVPEPASVVHACSALVKPGGWVFFSTLNRNAKAFMQAIVAAEYVLNLLPRGTHEYAKMIRPSELAASCRSAGLHVQHAKGLAYNPLTQRYRLSADTGVNYLLATRRIT